MDEAVRVVKVPTIKEAIAKRNAATPFDEPYVPSEGPRLHCLPAFDPDPDGIHVIMEAEGVRGRLLPVCARMCAKAIELYLLDVKKHQKLATFEKGPLATGYSSEVTENMGEIGGFGFYTEEYETYVHLHSIETGRGVVFGPLTFGDQQEFHDRLRGAFEKLPAGAVERSIVKLNLQQPPTRIVPSWEHGEHPPELG
jgi:hypothetical protein